jgi:hypothetical protein
MQNKIYQIIDSVLSGESSAENELFLIEWLESNCEDTKEFINREKLWNAVDIYSTNTNLTTGLLFNKFKAETRQKSFSKKIVEITFRWAAIGLLLIGIGTVGYYLFRARPPVHAMKL